MLERQGHSPSLDCGVLYSAMGSKGQLPFHAMLLVARMTYGKVAKISYDSRHETPKQLCAARVISYRPSNPGRTVVCMT